MVAITISLFLFLLTIIIIYRLNQYIITLENQVKKQNELVENLHQSLKDVIAEGFLENDGRLKKFAIQKERNFIYNGLQADKGEFEI